MGSLDSRPSSNFIELHVTIHLLSLSWLKAISPRDPFGESAFASVEQIAFHLLVFLHSKQRSDNTWQQAAGNYTKGSRYE